MKTTALVVGICIGLAGILSIIAPSEIAWVAEQVVTPRVFYVVAVVRVAFGLILVFVAPTSRAPKTLRVLGCIIVILGISTAITGLVAIEQARAAVDWWVRQGSGIVRLTGVVLVAFGSFVVYACAPARRE